MPVWLSSIQKYFFFFNANKSTLLYRWWRTGCSQTGQMSRLNPANMKYQTNKQAWNTTTRDKQEGTVWFRWCGDLQKPRCSESSFPRGGAPCGPVWVKSAKAMWATRRLRWQRHPHYLPVRLTITFFGGWVMIWEKKMKRKVWGTGVMTRET